MIAFPVITKNGNVTIITCEDGTQYRVYEDELHVQYPISLDCKITNYCDLMCPYCHESSNIGGTTADLDKASEFLSDLLVGTEIAIGGGNPLSHPKLEHFLRSLDKLNLIPNMTVNQAHIPRFYKTIEKLINEKLIYGIGVSINLSVLDNFDYHLISNWNNAVLHVIIGIHPIEKILQVLEHFEKPKLLVLGYKQYGRGATYYSHIQKEIDKWKEQFVKILLNRSNLILSFDNLAIEQLDVKSLVSEDTWNSYYLGEDGIFSMYVDFVTWSFGINSCSDRLPIGNKTIKECFEKVKQLKKGKEVINKNHE